MVPHPELDDAEYQDESSSRAIRPITRKRKAKSSLAGASAKVPRPAQVVQAKKTSDREAILEQKRANRVGCDAASILSGVRFADSYTLSHDRLKSNVTDFTVKDFHAAICKFSKIKGKKAVAEGPPDSNTWLFTGVRTHLQDHQLLGAAKMRELEDNDLKMSGGVLADMMEFGKTFTMLATSSTARENSQTPGRPCWWQRRPSWTSGENN